MLSTAPTDVLPDGLVVVVKRDCPTCRLVVPAIAELRDRAGMTVTVVSQDDPAFPDSDGTLDDRDLEVSFALELDTVPTLLLRRDGRETARTVGWSRERWATLSGVTDLGADLPEHRPGCASLTQDPAIAEARALREAVTHLRSRRVVLGVEEDEFEAMHARGWSDGLPLVPPTPERVARMLTGTDRDPAEVVADIPPDLVPATVEKVAVNAVMAGCAPEHLPVVLAAVEAYCTPEFNGHGLLCTTYSAGPVIVVNGPITRRIGMNSGMNVLGQGNRANASIGRALGLVVRNVGGGRPGEIDRATFGNPGKISLCFAEDEAGSPWEPLSVSRGWAEGTSTVTLFAGEGPRVVVDQISRRPESLARSIAVALRGVAHHKLPLAFDAVLVVSPEHARVFRDARWTRARLLEELHGLLQLDGADLVRGADGIDEGVPESLRDVQLPKFRPDGLLVVHAGGGAGMWSAVIGGWVNGATGSTPVTWEVRS